MQRLRSTTWFVFCPTLLRLGAMRVCVWGGGYLCWLLLRLTGGLTWDAQARLAFATALVLVTSCVGVFAYTHSHGVAADGIPSFEQYGGCVVVWLCWCAVR